MGNPVVESSYRKNITATNTALSAGFLVGIFVSQASSTPTLKVADADGTIANTFTPTAGVFYPFPCKYKGGLTVTISGTVDATIFYDL